MPQFKTYKELFNNIEDEWEQSYFMEDDFAGKEDTPSVAAEVDEIYAWNETTTDNPMEAEILAEVNEVYHKYGRYPTQCGYWTPRPRPQNFRAPFRYPGIDPDSNKPGTPPTMQGEENQSPHNGHQRANTTHISSQSKANGVNHILSNKANAKHSNKKDHNSQHKLVNRPAQIKQTEELQEHKCHKEILSVHIDDTQKSMYNAKVGSTEATALFDSGATLSCISKCFYDHICHIKPSMVINTNAGPVFIVTLASDDELINLG